MPFLNPGIYDVKAEAPKFETTDKTSITLVTGQTARVDFSLVPGVCHTNHGSGRRMQPCSIYDKADRGMVLDQQSIAELPVTAGSTFNLALLSPGVMTTSAGSPWNQSAQTYAIHGAGD